MSLLRRWELHVWRSDGKPIRDDGQECRVPVHGWRDRIRQVRAIRRWGDEFQYTITRV